MKLAGLMCWHFDPTKTLKHHDSLADLCEVCDEVFILDDQSEPPFPKFYLAKYPKIQSIIRIDDSGSHEWNDWTGHCTLLIAAAKRQCTHVLWLDDDEGLFPCNRELILKIISTMEKVPTSVATYLYWRHVWNEPNLILMEGVFKFVKKPFIQKNPFYRSGLICFPNTPDRKLHSWPVQTGTILRSECVWVLHWGLYTAQDRAQRKAKYLVHDPEGRFKATSHKEFIEAADKENPELLDTNDLTSDWYKWKE